MRTPIRRFASFCPPEAAQTAYLAAQSFSMLVDIAALAEKP